MADEQCIFCLIAEGKIQSAKIFEDNDCVAFLDIRPATKGHIQIIPKMHSPVFVNVDDAVKQKIFSIAFKLGESIVKKLGATGVSYIINEGAGASQRVAHASLHIIPRYENDGVEISWPEKQMNEKEISEYLNSVISALTSQEPAPAKNPEPKLEKKEEKPKDEPEINIKPRIPKYW